MHAAAINLRGGVSPRGARLRGQSIIEYVLIIVIIGLVIVFAGPGVAGAIRNQFNLVGNTVNNRTAGGVEGGGATGGGSADADSATVQAAIAKDAKDWTLDEQKAVAKDIAAKGEASPVYSKAKAAMNAGTKFSVKLTNGETLKYRIIGINHDDLADGSGKAGLTFLTTSTGIRSQMNATKMNEGGWEKSDLRRKMNSGEIWNLMPFEFKSKVKPVTKLTNNINGDYTGRNVTATSDRLFLLSCYEIVPQSYGWGTHYPWTFSEGFQYEAFKDKVSGSGTTNDCLNIGVSWWERTVYINSESTFSSVWSGSGHASYSMYASDSLCVCPAWCF